MTAMKLTVRVVLMMFVILGVVTLYVSYTAYYSSTLKVKQPVTYRTPFRDIKITAVHPKPPEKACHSVETQLKFDCHPENFPTKEMCEYRGCCWIATPARKKPISSPDPLDSQAPVDVPYCFYPGNYSAYRVINTEKVFTGTEVLLKRDSPSYYPKDIQYLNVNFNYETPTRLRIKIYDSVANRYEVPIVLDPARQPPHDPAYRIHIQNDTFHFKVIRKADGKHNETVLMDTSLGAMIFSDQFLQISSLLPSHNIYGLGQHRSHLNLNTSWSRFTMWNRDHFPIEEDANLYGSHPFYLVMEDSGLSHGVFLLNSNAMDVILQPTPAITWRTIGGVLDFYILLGPTPIEVVQQYTQLVSRSFMPPYWSLGYHQCRWGYNTTSRTLDVVHRLRKAGIPQDVQWNDMDYANNYMDFTYDPEKFGDLPAMVTQLHSEGLHYIMIVDAAISTAHTKGSYPAYDLAIEKDILVKDGFGKQPIKGKVWPNETVWPDWSHPDATDYWTHVVSLFYDKVKFDGMWIDMNEPSNLGNNDSVTLCDFNSTLENPPYLPAVANYTLRFMTLCATAHQSLGRRDKGLDLPGLHYDLHNLYGLMMAQASYKALERSRELRPFVISRSTYAGHGQYGGHWTGDNSATWHDLRMSIPAILNGNMYGISMIGADICGFHSDTTPELCQRWMQLGAFYPFSRNHNEQGTIDQDPASLGPGVAASSRRALLIRYKLLPYLYWLFYRSHVYGDPVVRPLFFKYPQDQITYRIDSQFMWGDALLISPVLTQDTTHVNAYFPRDTWYCLYSGKRRDSLGEYYNLAAPLDIINLHVRAGHVIPQQEPSLTTTESRKNPFKLLVTLDEFSHSSGELYWDDGESLNTHDRKLYTLIRFKTLKNKIYSRVDMLGYKDDLLKLEQMTVFGMAQKPKQVKVKSNLHDDFYYDDSHNVLYVNKMNITLYEAFVVTWTFTEIKDLS
ncbi:unnamed protein product [Owenia fusiformis]|uniref:Uncharacterized protein n=1 Tax=Owenia fusiformis TaxID=6347 RepID=A0A8J1XX57_OWEFU|nr:unnamed protein product [Owenia fusiformis]